MLVGCRLGLAIRPDKRLQANSAQQAALHTDGDFRFGFDDDTGAGNVADPAAAAESRISDGASDGTSASSDDDDDDSSSASADESVLFLLFLSSSVRCHFPSFFGFVLCFHDVISGTPRSQ